jgi:hypothetical protein
VDNEGRASDPQINQAHIIQISINADAYTQKLLGVPTQRLNHFFTTRNDQPQPLTGYDPTFPNPYSSVSEQAAHLVDNYAAIASKIPDDRSGHMYENDNRPTIDEKLKT